MMCRAPLRKEGRYLIEPAEIVLKVLFLIIVSIETIGSCMLSQAERTSRSFFQSRDKVVFAKATVTDIDSRFVSFVL